MKVDKVDQITPPDYERLTKLEASALNMAICAIELAGSADGAFDTNVATLLLTPMGKAAVLEVAETSDRELMLRNARMVEKMARRLATIVSS